jgi:uncharacterized metal-binding protein
MHIAEKSIKKEEKMADNCCAEGSNRMILWCAGASNVGQMTHQVAVELAGEGQGKLFCLAGIAAHMSGFVRSAKDANDMIVLDGCSLKCAARVLEHIDVPARNHFVLTDMGVEKAHGVAIRGEDIERVKASIRAELS